MATLPPQAKKVPFVFEHFGREFSDPYIWLQNKNDPSVLEYLEAENKFAEIGLAHTEALQDALFHEMRGRLQEKESSVPTKHGDYFYYWRIEAGQQYKIYCRKQSNSTNSEQILVDENKLAEGLSYCKLTIFEPSPDNRFLAYGVDTTGALKFDLFIMDMASGEIILGPIKETAWTVAWASDSVTLFYTVFDESHRPFELYKFDLLTKTTQKVFHETDDAFNLSIHRTMSGKFLLLTSASASTSEVRYILANEPNDNFTVIHPRQHWLEYYVIHHEDYFIIRTNENAENFKLMRVPIRNPVKQNWEELIPHQTDVFIEEMEVFQNHLVLFERANGIQRIRVSSPEKVDNFHFVDFPDPIFTVHKTENKEFSSQELRFSYTSLTTPLSVIDYDMNLRKWIVMKEQEIPSGYNKKQYTSERVFATAPDGTRVPMSLVHRKDFVKDGTAPAVLYGYGSYGYSTDPAFDIRRLSLLDRGFIYAIAHVRGGSELGRAWYENGRLMNKKNTFNDFNACAEYLIKTGYSSPDRLAILGGSAGGLLVSTAINMRPDLFKAVVALVPFTNVITAMLDRNLPLTVIEWEQWGNPNEELAFDYMLSYSPYENVEAKSYPNILVRTGLNDLQVPYWDPAKWVARLREKKTDQNSLYLITDMGSGHGGASGRYDYLREHALYYAFIIDALSSPSKPIVP